MTIEVSDDLLEWRSGSEHIETLLTEDGEGIQTVTVRAIGYPGQNDRGFLRLQVVPQ